MKARGAALEDGYRRAQASTALHGRTYYLGTRLLPAHRRRGVYALYGFARMVDDLVDIAGHRDPQAALDDVESQVNRTVDETARRGGSVPAEGITGVDHRILALVDTIVRFDIPLEYFTAFLTSMRMDTPGTARYRNRYRTFSELDEYMYGSAAVIGLQMLPILGTVDAQAAAPPARALGEAFQLTNFIRDIGEDLDRDRIYLPTDELTAFGVDADMLHAARRSGVAPAPVVRAIAHCIAVTRARYRDAEPGVALISSRSRPAIRAAFDLYRDILDEVEALDHQILDRRVVVGRRRRARRALTAVALRR